MKKIDEYNALIEIAANARLLAALSDDSETTADALDIIKRIETAVRRLEHSSSGKFKDDSIARYMGLLQHIDVEDVIDVET